MTSRDQIRLAIRNLNHADFTRTELKEKLPNVSRYAIDKDMAYLVKEGEITKCGEMTLRTGGKRTFYREVKLKEKYVRPVIERKDLTLKGWRKVFPEFFIDPNIPGVCRFVDNGLRQ